MGTPTTRRSRWTPSGSAPARRRLLRGRALRRQGQTLPDYLDRHEVRHPARLRAWLGEVGVYPGTAEGLPPGFRLSASRLSAFAQCSWRAYAESALALRAPEEISEDLDASEIGSAMHVALERAAMGVRWIVPTASVAGARQAFLERLVAATQGALDEQAKQRPASVETSAMVAARAGLSARWGRHWAHYARARIVGFDEAREAVLRELFGRLRDTEDFGRALDALGPSFSAAQRAHLSEGLFAALIDAGGDLERLAPELVVGGLGKKTVGVTRAILAAPRPPALAALCERARASAGSVEYHRDGDLEVVGLEVAFGRARDDGEPLWLRLGEERVEVRGSIDVIDRRHGIVPDAGARYRVGDFKTGGSAGTAKQIASSLVRPQLTLYALALEERGPLEGHPRPAVTEELYYDQVRSLGRTVVPLDQPTLEHARRTLARALSRPRRGSWPLMPHPDGCPLRGVRTAYCDFQEICRLRGSFAPEDDAEAPTPAPSTAGEAGKRP
ncbi:MAG: PD-(D/E)XK nuclease family protein [Planctomycetes bacterium]|nr:PD-(D/E)XK nuclease family protein [Planctomycetota bacterium]